MFHVLYAVLLISSTIVHADSNATTISFLLMVSSTDYSTLVDQTLEEINMEFGFQMKYRTNDNEVSWIKSTSKILFEHAVQCNKSFAVLLQRSGS